MTGRGAPRRTLATLAGAGLLTALLALSLPGCGVSPAAGGGPARDVSVTGLDTMRFAPDALTVARGEAVTLTFRNAGVITHDLVIRGPGTDVRLVSVAGGTEQRATFRPTRPGTYAVICTQPGHREAGMVGRLVVAEPAAPLAPDVAPAA